MSLWDQVRALRKSDFRPPAGLKVLVVADLPRSGTWFLTDMLLQLGVSVGHEAVFGMSRVYDPPRANPTGSPAVEVSGFAAPWAWDCVCHGVHVIGYHRHPVRVINSCLNYFPQGSHELSWDETCAEYLSNGQLINKAASEHVYLELLPCGIHKILAALPQDLMAMSPSRAYEAARRGASSPLPLHGTWGDLPNALKKHARSHGYCASN